MRNNLSHGEAMPLRLIAGQVIGQHAQRIESRYSSANCEIFSLCCLQFVTINVRMVFIAVCGKTRNIIEPERKK